MNLTEILVQWTKLRISVDIGKLFPGRANQAELEAKVDELERKICEADIFYMIPGERYCPSCKGLGIVLGIYPDAFGVPDKRVIDCPQCGGKRTITGEEKEHDESRNG